VKKFESICSIFQEKGKIVPYHPYMNYNPSHAREAMFT